MLIFHREETFNDVLMKGLKKSKGAERCDLLLTLCVLALQLGEDQYVLYSTMKALLLTMAKDHSVSPMERAMVSVLLCFSYTCITTCAYLYIGNVHLLLSLLSFVSRCSGMSFAHLIIITIP